MAFLQHVSDIRWCCTVVIVVTQTTYVVAMLQHISDIQWCCTVVIVVTQTSYVVIVVTQTTYVVTASCHNKESPNTFKINEYISKSMTAYCKCISHEDK